MSTVVKMQPNKPAQPTVFMSYAWTSDEHRERVRKWAEDLMAEGVMVILDEWDAQHGNDLNAFMERTVTDHSITHVLIFSDRVYAEKADTRKASGVGTETQLISKKVYEEVGQEKFIPIFCELDEAGKPIVPAYLASRRGIDFSSDEKVNANWQQLVRTLHGKPRFVKPELGKAPAYLDETTAAPDPARRKFQSLQRALDTNSPAVPSARADFLDACITYAESLRQRTPPAPGDHAARILGGCQKLVPVRDHLIDWTLLEAGRPDFDGHLIEVMERLGELRARPVEVNSWDNSWFKAHEYFAYETFLYIVAALIRRRKFTTVRRILTANYLRPETEQHGDNHFFSYREFGFDGELLQSALNPPAGRKWLSPAAELVKRLAQRADITFNDLVQADFLIFFKSVVEKDRGWYPQLQHKRDRYKQFPLFLKAARKADFAALATVVGKAPTSAGADEIRTIVKESLGSPRTFGDFWPDELERPMNLKALCTLE